MPMSEPDSFDQRSLEPCILLWALGGKAAKRGLGFRVLGLRGRLVCFFSGLRGPVINDNQQTLRQQLERSLSQIPLEEQQAQS